MGGELRRGKPNPTATCIRILEYVGRFGTGVSAKEIVEGLAIPPATCYRLLNTLVEDEFLVRTADLRGFALGSGITDLVESTARPLVPQNAKTVLDEFRLQTRFALHLIMLRGNGLKIGQADPDHPILYETELRKHLHASAPGKLLLSQAPEWEGLLPPGSLTRLTSATICDRRAIERALSEIRTENVSREFGELSEGQAGIAVGVPIGPGICGAALWLVGLPERASAMERHVEDLSDFASRLAPALF